MTSQVVSLRLVYWYSLSVAPMRLLLTDGSLTMLCLPLMGLLAEPRIKTRGRNLRPLVELVIENYISSIVR